MILPFELPLTLGDILAVALHLGTWAGIGWLVENPPRQRISVSVAMRDYRREWMRHFVSRDPRMFDSAIMNILQQSTSFFASACMIATGGGLALLANPGTVAQLAREVTLTPAAALELAPELVWQIRIILPLILVIYAFLKFVWAHRLFGYCSILMASVPNDPADPKAMPQAMRAAEINISAARNFNAALRAVYFGIGALAWLAGPWPLTLATVVVLWTTWRREFASASRRAIISRD